MKSVAKAKTGAKAQRASKADPATQLADLRATMAKDDADRATERKESFRDAVASAVGSSPEETAELAGNMMLMVVRELERAEDDDVDASTAAPVLFAAYQLLEAARENLVARR